MFDKKITFVFQSGRIQRLNSKEQSYSKEFFYAYHNFKKEFTTVNIIEFNDSNKIMQKIIKKISEMLRYLTTIPFYFEKIINIKNFKIFQNSEHIIFTNQRVAFTSFPLLQIVKLFNKDLQSSVFIMGLFVNQSNNIVRIKLRKIFVNLLLRKITNIFFLGLGEYEFAKVNYKKYSHKYTFLPFPIDIDFWKSTTSKSKNDKILFIGNDGKRDYKKVISIANSMEEFSFIFVSNNINKENLKHNNVKVYEGSWAENKITDLEIKNIYEQSFLTIIPLIESNQPSGQSVALQSMAVGVPVLMSKTSGFWDLEKFNNNRNILFIENDEINSWITQIIRLRNDAVTINNLANNALKTLEENYDLLKFYDALKKIIIS